MYDNRDPSGYGTGYDQRPPTTRQVLAAMVSRWTRNLGAIISVVMILGVVVWAYRLSERAASGLPVLQAPEGAARLAPDDPGGSMARHVGLAVNEVAGSGMASAGPTRVMLAPASQVLSDDDVPMSGVRNVPLVERIEPVLPPEAEPATAPTAQVDVVDSDTSDAAGDETTQTASSAAPVAVVRPPEQPYRVSTNGPDDRISASIPGVKSSPRPSGRASQPSVPAQGATTTAPTAAPPRAAPIETKTVAVGTRVANLGTFGSADVAKSEWDRLVRKFGDLMDGKQPLIQATTSGDQVYYRLRASGFDDVADSIDFCSVIVATKNNCVPTVVRE